MRFGSVLKAGDVVLAKVQFTDRPEIKIRPAVVLFEEQNNVVIAGITSNLSREGILLTKKDGAIKDCVIRLNYIFTTSEMMIIKVLFHLDSPKKKMIFHQLQEKIGNLMR